MLGTSVSSSAERAACSFSSAAHFSINFASLCLSLLPGCTIGLLLRFLLQVLTLVSL
jgi:hypothetical protein